MRATRFLAALLAAAVLLAGPGCDSDASFHGGEASPLSCDVVVLGDTLGAYVCAIEAAAEGAAVLLLYGLRSSDPWLLEEGAVAAPPLSAEDPAADMYTETYLRRDLTRSGGLWGQSRHYDLLAGSAYADLHWFAGLVDDFPEQSAPGLFCLPRLSYDQAVIKLSRSAGERGVRIISGAATKEIAAKESGGFFSLRVDFSGGRTRQINARAVVMAQGGYLFDRGLMNEVAAGVFAAPWRTSGDGEAVRQAIALNLDLVQLDHFAYALALEKGESMAVARYPAQSLLVAGGQVQPVSGLTEEEILNILLQEESRTGLLVVAGSHLVEAERENFDWSRYTGIDSLMVAHSLDLPVLRRWVDNPWDSYYSVSISALAEYCLGGIAVSEGGQVLRGGEPVPGLYALGEAAGGLHGRTLLPGAAFSEALVWGRHIGREVARLALQ